MSNTHIHLLVDANFEKTPILTDIPFVTKWCNDLVVKLKMEIFVPPIVKYCDDPSNEGLSFLLALTTSHCSGHWWDTFGKFDVYSCSAFEPNVFLEMLEVFKPTRVSYMQINRSNSDFCVMEQGEN